MNFVCILIAGMYLVSLWLYVDSLVKLFEEDELDVFLYLLAVGAGVLSCIYFALLKLDYVNFIFMGLYGLMFFATYTGSKVSNKIEED